MPSPLASWCGICGQRRTLQTGDLFPSAAWTGISSIEDPALNVNPALADGTGQLVEARLEVAHGTAEGQAALRLHSSRGRRGAVRSDVFDPRGAEAHLTVRSLGEGKNGERLCCDDGFHADLQVFDPGYRNPRARFDT